MKKRKYHETDTEPLQPVDRQWRLGRWIVYALAVVGVMFLAYGIGRVINPQYYGQPPVQRVVHVVTATPAAACTLEKEHYRNGSFGIGVTIQGSRKDDAVIDVFAPGMNEPLPVWIFRETPILKSEETYFEQIYSTTVDMEPGAYRVKATLDGKTTSETFDLLYAEYAIRAHCN